jgi:phosphate transport system substrate-binding protein
MTMSRRRSLPAAALFLAVALAGSSFAQTVQLNGAGATFPAPIYTKWFSEYHKLHPNVQINYQAIGSGGGIRQITERTVDFGATDGPMTVDQIQAAPGIMHFPTVLGAVVPIYNVPGVDAELKFTGPLLADIFMGKVTKWNDAAIAAINQNVTLPASDIAVVHRSDGSGTTYIFADYLAKVSPEWKKSVGVATALKWPVGVGAKGNDGVAGQVKQQPGGIGYVELIYAVQNNIDFGTVQNSAGKFVKASLAGVTAAAAVAVDVMPKDFRVSITNAPGDTTYPITSFTWLLVYEKQKDKEKGKILTEFMRWMLTEGQKMTESLSYAPLPKGVVDKELEALEKVK